MPRLSLRLLGALQVTLDGIPLTRFESDKERALLAYLAEESQQPHRREKLAGLLWPERSEAAARNNLRRVISNLRCMLGDRTPSGPPCLLVTGQTVRFNPACGAWIDSLTFASLLSPPGQQPGPQLEEAIHLYQGDFLEGFSIADSPAFEEWIVLCRERYQRMMMEALHRLVEEYEGQGHYERALPLAWRQLDLEPWWEEAHRQLIRLLAHSGRRSEALAQYLKCRRVLAEELDVKPSTETTGLYEQIRDEALAVSSPSPQHRPSPTHNLPVTSGPFIGREAEIRAIQGHLQDPACRLLTLVGAGGMGKTRLALEAVAGWIARLGEYGLDGAALVSLAPLQTAEAIVPAIAQAIGFPLSPGREPGQQLLSHLAQKRWLLILDSFEHLSDGAGFVAEILAIAPSVKVLVTSRTRLNLHAEYCFPVSGIEFPQQIPEDAQQGRRFAAVQLFLQAAHRIQPGFEPANADLAEIARICRLVQGMPLGILLAAAWLGVLGPAEIAAEIGQDLDFLEADWPDVPKRQRSVRAVFDRSWNLLTVGEREVFQALSIFSGGFTRAAAKAVSGASSYELRALADKSLLQVTPSGRYEIHELLRQYATEKLGSSPDTKAAIRDRHCVYYTAALQRWEADLTGFRQQEAMIEMEAERENIRAAWAWAVEEAQIERLDRAMEGLEHFYWQSGRHREAEAALRAAAAAAAAAVEKVCAIADCLRVWVRALAWQSNFQRALGQKAAARQLQQQCLTLLQNPALVGGDTRLERAILSWSIGVTVCMSDYAQGRLQFEDSFSLFRDLDHQWGMAWALDAWGTMSMYLGDYCEAKQRLEEAMAIHKALGNESGIAASLSHLAEISWRQGRFEEAERLARSGSARSQETGNRAASAFGLLNLGEALERTGKFAAAHSASQRSLALYKDLQHRSYITQARSDLGSIDLHLGRYEEARDHVAAGLALAREHGPRFCIGLNQLLLGCVELAQGAYATAHQLLQDGVAVYQETGPQDDLALALACLAVAARELGDRCKARQYLCQAFELAVASGAVPPLLWTLPATALLLASEGKGERAVELYALARTYPFVANSRWFEDMAGRKMAAIATDLCPEVAQAAQARGQARDLWQTAAELLEELASSGG